MHLHPANLPLILLANRLITDQKEGIIRADKHAEVVLAPLSLTDRVSLSSHCMHEHAELALRNNNIPSRGREMGLSSAEIIV